MLVQLKKNEALTIATGLFAFSMSLGPFAMSAGLVLFIFTSIFHFGKDDLSKKNVLFLLGYCMLFLMYLAGIFFTPYVERGLQLIVRTSPILIVPLALVLSGAYKKIDYYLVRQYFIFGTFLSCLISISAALLKLLAGSDSQEIFYFGFTEAISLHPSYYSLYILTSFVFLMDTPKLLLPFLKSFVALILVIALILSQSKIALVIFLLLMLFYFVRALRKKLTKESVLTGVLLAVFFTIGISLEGGRLNELVKIRQLNEIGTFSEDGVSQRIWLWKTAMKHVKDKPLFGFGLGAQERYFKYRVEKDILKQDVDASYIKASKALSSFNFHNNYIQIWYEFGVVGVLLFLSGSVVVITIGFKRRNHQAILIYTIFLLMLTVEVMLNRQMGIYYFSFIPAFLLLESNKKE